MIAMFRMYAIGRAVSSHAANLFSRQRIERVVSRHRERGRAGNIHGRDKRDISGFDEIKHDEPFRSPRDCDNHNICDA